MAGAALLAEPRSPHTHTHMQEEEEEEGGPCIFMPGSQEGAGPAGTANRGPLPHRRPAGTAGTARPGHRGRPPHTARPGTGGSAARPAISPPPVMSPAECRGPAGAGRGSGVPSGAGRGGCAAARGALGAARAAQTKETRTDTHTHPAPRYLPAPLPRRGAGRQRGTSIPRQEGRHRANFEIASGRTSAGIRRSDPAGGAARIWPHAAPCAGTPSLTCSQGTISSLTLVILLLGFHNEIPSP